MSNLSMLAKASAHDNDRSAILEKKAAQARARRALKKGKQAPAVVETPKVVAVKKTAVKAKPSALFDRHAKLETVQAFNDPPGSEPVSVKVNKAGKPTGRGGAREGSGPKPLYDGEVMSTISFKGTAAHRKEFVEAGGSAWVRAGLDERIAFKKKGGK